MTDNNGNGKLIDFVTALRQHRERKNVDEPSPKEGAELFEPFDKVSENSPNFDKVYNPWKINRRWKNKLINVVKEAINSGEISIPELKQMLLTLSDSKEFTQIKSKYNLNQSRYLPRFAESSDVCDYCIDEKECPTHAKKL